MWSATLTCDNYIRATHKKGKQHKRLKIITRIGTEDKQGSAELQVESEMERVPTD